MADPTPDTREVHALLAGLPRRRVPFEDATAETYERLYDSRDHYRAESERLRAELAALTGIVAGTALLGADDAVGMVRALTEHLAASGEISADQAERVLAGLDRQQADAVTVVQVSANLERYISERAALRAEAALARAQQEADRRVAAVREDLGAQLRRQEELTAELRKQVAAAECTIRRGTAGEREREQQVEQLRDELAAAIGAPRDTDLNTLVRRTRICYAALIKQRNEANAERDEAVREMREEARTADALRKNRDQLNDELTAARRQRPRRGAQRWERDVDRRTVARLIAAWEDGAAPLDTLRRIKRVVADNAATSGTDDPAEPEVTVPPGTPPAAQRCPHRDFDDPDRCRTCHP